MPNTTTNNDLIKIVFVLLGIPNPRLIHMLDFADKLATLPGWYSLHQSDSHRGAIRSDVTTQQLRRIATRTAVAVHD